MSFLIGLFKPIPISTRNSPQAVANLLFKTSCHFIICSVGSAVDQIVNDVKRSPPLNDLNHEVKITLLPSVNVLFPHLGHETESHSFNAYSNVEYHAQDKVALYIHSSGSTGLPKPIPFTQRYMYQVMNLRECYCSNYLTCVNNESAL